MDNLNDQTLTQHLDNYCREQTRIMNEVKGGHTEDKFLTRELQVIGSIINGLIKLRDLKRKKADKM